MRLLERLLRAVAVMLGALRAARHPEPPAAGGDDQEAVDPRRRELPRDPRAELTVAALLLACAAFGVAFAVLLGVNASTQLLGLSLALAFACLAGALGIAGKRVVPQVTEVEERPHLHRPEEGAGLQEDVGSAADGVSRRRLLGASAAIAGAGLTAALVAPATSLGPRVGDRIAETPWRPGRRLVDEEGKPISADDIAEGAFVTAFPEGADKRELGSPVVVVRVDPATLDLPAGRQGWAPEGLLAYSKICTHAGCAIALYRSPKFESVEVRPALACPCHYSAFDVRRGADVIEGPAGRPLPQLPLRIGPGRELQADGGLSGPVGPAWWSVRRS